MNYKETLFFVGKCLTINHEVHNKEIVEEQLKNNNVDWDSVVKLSTAHYVFPALYCNLQKANFLHYLPEDLVAYMKHITDLNRERNQQIIEQAQELNQLLLDNGVTPIFLKGTGNLLEGLYDDIAERMVGDIDFIIYKKDYEKSITILKEFGYAKIHNDNYDPLSFKHYPELTKKGRVAAVEVHKNVLNQKYVNEFDYNIIIKNCLVKNKISFLSYKNQLNLTIIAIQINDNGRYYKNIALRNAYDVFLLSKKTNTQNAYLKFKKLKTPIINFLAISNIVFNDVDSLAYEKNKDTKKFTNTFLKNIENNISGKQKYLKTKKKLFIKERLTLVYKSFFNKEYRKWLFNRINDKKWQDEKLIQLGLKKTKPNS